MTDRDLDTPKSRYATPRQVERGLEGSSMDTRKNQMREEMGRSPHEKMSTQSQTRRAQDGSEEEMHEVQGQERDGRDEGLRNTKRKMSAQNARNAGFEPESGNKPKETEQPEEDKEQMKETTRMKYAGRGPNNSIALAVHGALFFCGKRNF